jgi:hypothetical protein
MASFHGQHEGLCTWRSDDGAGKAYLSKSPGECHHKKSQSVDELQSTAIHKSLAKSNKQSPTGTQKGQEGSK